MKALPDIQASTEGFPQISIQKVGVRHIRVPIILDPKKGQVIADFSAYCELNAETKGINMSRMAETVTNHVLAYGGDPLPSLYSFALRMKEAHKSNWAYVKAAFNHLLMDLTPITSKPTYETLPVVIECSIAPDGTVKQYVQITYTGMSLCPCSKEMSLLMNNITDEEKQLLSTLETSLFSKIKAAGFGAHSQKSHAEIKVEWDPNSVDLVSLINYLHAIAKTSVSSHIVALLKRPDEKYVTEVSYMGGYFDESGVFVEVGGGPAFVEDIVRRVADQLNLILFEDAEAREAKGPVIKDYVIVVNNDESIHSNDMVATAVLSAGKGLK